MEMDTVRRQKSPAGAQGLADVLFEHTTSVVHVFSALVVICVVYLGWADKMTLFHWHPILYTIGVSYFCTIFFIENNVRNGKIIRVIIKHIYPLVT